MRSVFRLAHTSIAVALAWTALAAASPLSTQPEQPLRSTPAEAVLLNNEQLGLRDALPGAGAALELADLATPRLRPGESQWNLGEGTERDLMAGRTRPLQDQLRGILNVERSQLPAGSSAAPRGAGEAPLDLEVGPAAADWVQDITRSLLHSTLRADVNERGQAVFSVLGVGEFTLTAAADRSAITLSSGEDALFSLHRLPRHEPAALPGEGRQAADARLRNPPTELREMIEAIAEMASHPLTLLVYCIVGGYFLLWALLAQQRARHQGPQASAAFDSGSTAPGGKRRVKRRRRQRAAATAREALPEAPAAAVGDTPRRKRVRVRMRIRVRKPHWRRPA